MKSKLLVVNCETSSATNILEFVESIPGKVNLRSRSDNLNETELVFELISKDHTTSVEGIKDLEGMIKVRLLNYSANN